MTICSASTSGPGEAQRLDVELMKLPVAALLRPLVAEHRPRGPYALRPLVGQVVLDGGADDAGGRLGTQRQALAVQLVLERVHLMLDDVGRIADAANEQRGGLDDRQAYVAVAVLAEDVACGVVEEFPRRRLVGQHVVHSADGLQRCDHQGHPYACALIEIDLRSGSRCAARGSPP